MKSRALRIVNVVSLALGLGLLVLLIVKQDPTAVWARLKQAGWYFPLGFTAYVLGLLTTTAAWHQLIDPARCRVGFGGLFRVFWAAHAVNQTTPAGALGEVYKFGALANRIDSDELMGSLISFNFLSLFSVQAATLLGPFLALLLLTLPGWVIGTLLGLAIACFVPIAILWALLRLGAVQRLVKVMTRIPLIRPRDPERWIEKAHRVDASIHACRTQRPARFYRALLWFATVRLLQIVEVWCFLIPLLPDRGLGWLFVLAALTQTATQLVAWAANFVPGQFGVMEGANSALFGLLGLSPVVGLSMELLRRSRKIIGVAIGLIIGWTIRQPAAPPPDILTDAPRPARIASRGEREADRG